MPFCVRFRRLFDLAVNKYCTVSQMFSLGWEVEGATCGWRRQLWVWEDDMLQECVALLLSVSMQSNVSYSWRWQLGPIGGYSVRGVYHLLTSQDSIQNETATDLIWHKQVPLKVSIFAWRLLRDRLPTKSNLLHRGIISADYYVCTTGYGHLETAHHLFLSCSMFGSLWHGVQSWIGISGVDPYSISDHLSQFWWFESLSLISTACMATLGLYYVE